MWLLCRGHRESKKGSDDLLFTFTDLMSIRFIHRHNVPYHVPLTGSISATDLAAKTNLDPIRLPRYLQHTMRYRVLSSRSLGSSHTLWPRGCSRLTRPRLTPSGSWSKSSRPWRAKWPELTEPYKTRFNIKFDTSNLFYLKIAKDPKRARRFGATMRFKTSGTFYNIKNLINR
ncbi:hypothetical protein BJY01DRAFT_228496 [Aspergillus pseudoustus]|uniref:Uncharacterized protein n=1 Tax=Aspergillus pseudoustus TaxID=1810923 RepID=A0ABR4IKS7_9EURO